MTAEDLTVIGLLVAFVVFLGLFLLGRDIGLRLYHIEKRLEKLLSAKSQDREPPR